MRHTEARVEECRQCVRKGREGSCKSDMRAEHFILMDTWKLVRGREWERPGKMETSTR
jgi:hypothetical protein